MPFHMARYRLASGFFTKSRLAVLGVLVVLAITVIAFGSKPREDGAWTPRTILAPGKVSQAHRFVENACTQCHATTWQKVADTTCKTCHDGPRHHHNQAFTPPCVTCHTEHRGRQAVLTGVDNRLCTQCHMDLQAHGVGQGARLKIVGPDAHKIHSFTSGHPEFAVSVQGEEQSAPIRVRLNNHPKDTAQVYFNHKVHLKPEKLGPEGSEQLTCGDCHRVDKQGAYMLSIQYEEHCMRCHRLEFDERFPKQVVPHDEPAVVHTFLRSTFTQYCLNRLLEPSEVGEAGVGGRTRQRPGRSTQSREETLSFKQCLDEEVQTAEPFLFRKKASGEQSTRQSCGLCHILLPPVPGTRFPAVAKPAIPQHWLSQSEFAHQVHARAGRSCEDCHRQARHSEQREDVLLPDLASCQECHSVSGKASTECVSCHRYHDRAELAKSLPHYMEGRQALPGAR
jgi:predicted CXXCH cytochrome family protein